MNADDAALNETGLRIRKRRPATRSRKILIGGATALALLTWATVASAAVASARPVGSSAVMPAAWVREALLHGEDLARVSRPGSAPSSAARTLTRTVVVGGMPGWQIALIVIGTALFAAVAAVLLDRARAARRRVDSSIRPAPGRSGQPDEDPQFPHGQAEIIGDDADLIGTADLAVLRTRPTPR